MEEAEISISTFEGFGVLCRVSRYPSSALLPFLFWGLLIKTRKQGTLVIIGLLGNLGSLVFRVKG